MQRRLSGLIRPVYSDAADCQQGPDTIEMPGAGCKIKRRLAEPARTVDVGAQVQQSPDFMDISRRKSGMQGGSARQLLPQQRHG